MNWTDEYLTGVAGEQASRYCDEPLGQYLARTKGNHRETGTMYRNCGGLPRSLLADVAVPYPLRFRPYRDNFDKLVLWTGRSNVSPLHFDPNHNFMHQVDGQKRLLLLDPVDGALLYADHSVSAVGNTPVDPYRVDLTAHPLAAQATLWPVVLNRGDLLFIPSQWWHMVLTVPYLRSGEERNIALTAQFDASHADRGLVSHFSRRRAELFLNFRPGDAPSPQELMDQRHGIDGETPTSMAEMRSNE